MVSLGPDAEDKKRGESPSSQVNSRHASECMMLGTAQGVLDGFPDKLGGGLDCSSHSDSGAWCEVGEREKIRTKRGRGRGKSR